MLVGLLARANNHYVSTEINYEGDRYATLRARASTALNWEKYTIVGDCAAGPGCALRSRGNGKYLTVEADTRGTDNSDSVRGGSLRAIAESIGRHQQFVIDGDCASAVGCGLRAKINGRYVTVDTDAAGNGRLRAGATRLGPSERFNLVSQFCPVTGCAIKSLAANAYVSTELDFTDDEKGVLRAGSRRVGSWERFMLLGDCSHAEGCAIRSVGNGKYVTAELDFDADRRGLLRAAAETVGAWERFTLEGDCIWSTCAIKSVAGGAYVTTELDTRTTEDGKDLSGMLRAGADSVHAWEKFIIVN